MNTEELMQYQQWAKAELMHCSEFWLKHGIDREHGGVYTCLDRAGKIYSTDKSVWMQGRCAWTYAYLCHIYGVKQEWLEASRSCLDFMEKYCINRAAGNRMYFTCLLYTSDAADELDGVDLGGRRIIKKKNK